MTIGDDFTDPEIDAVVVRTERKTDFEEKLKKKTLTSGCAQGTVFGDVMAGLEAIRLPEAAHARILPAPARGAGEVGVWSRDTPSSGGGSRMSTDLLFPGMSMEQIDARLKRLRTQNIILGVLHLGHHVS